MARQVGKTKSPKMGRLIHVKNLSRKNRANQTYFCVKLEAGQDICSFGGVGPRMVRSGEEFYALFTHHQIVVAIDRAKANPEDVDRVHLLRDLID